MRPLRVSSEGPEVVPSHFDSPLHSPDKFLVPFSDRFNQPSTLFLQKQSNPPESDPALFTPPPLTPKRFDTIPPSFAQAEDSKGRNHALSLIPIVLLVLVGLLIGGGVAGGVGGAIVVQKQQKINSLETSLLHLPTTTVTAPSSVSTIILDPAGCPLINNSTYNAATPGYDFLMLCATEITSPPGSNIDASNSQQTTFESCLDACASYNQNVQKGGCVGASWVIFSPTHPEKNSICFLKNATGVQTSAREGSQTVVSGYLKT